MTRRPVKIKPGAASLLVGGLCLTAASLATAVGIGDRSATGDVMIAAGILIACGFAADRTASTLDGAAGIVVHTGMAVGIVSILLHTAIGTHGFTVSGILGFVGILGFAVAGVGLTVAGTGLTARSCSAGTSPRNGHGNRSLPPLRRVLRVYR
jgi:hypothetical protein